MLESYLYFSEDYNETLYYFNKCFLEEKDYLKEEDLLGNYKIDGEIKRCAWHENNSSIDLWKASKFIRMSRKDLRSGKISIMNILKQDKMIIWRN